MSEITPEELRAAAETYMQLPGARLRKAAEKLRAAADRIEELEKTVAAQAPEHERLKRCIADLETRVPPEGTVGIIVTALTPDAPDYEVGASIKEFVFQGRRREAKGSHGGWGFWAYREGHPWPGQSIAAAKGAESDV